MVLAAVDVVDGEGAGGAGIAGGCVGHAAVFEDRVVLAHRGGDGGDRERVGEGKSVDLGGGRIIKKKKEVGVDDLFGGERVGQGLIEGVGPRPGGGGESVGGIGGGQVVCKQKTVFAVV